MPAKRGDRVTPPARPGGWDARFATSDAAKGWEELCRVARGNTWEAWIVLTERPRGRRIQHGSTDCAAGSPTRDIGGRTLDQWQYEVTAGGRIWYCPDEDRRIVRVVAASPSHPKVTE